MEEANREVAVEVSREGEKDQEEEASINNKGEEEDNIMEEGRTGEEGNTRLARGCK